MLQYPPIITGGESLSDSRALVIGLDGVPFRLLEALFAYDAMPFLRAMLEQSYRAPLASTVPPMSATAWTTFATGVNPGRHGILHFVNLRPQQGEGTNAQWVFPNCASLLDASQIPQPTLWQILTAAGKRQAIVNVPLTYPPYPVDGVMITGMLTPPSASVFTSPPELSEELRREGYEIDLDVEEKDFDFDHHQLVSRLRQVQRKRTEVALRLLRQEAWDLFMLVYTGTDRAQHHCWKYLVPGAPEYDSPDALALRPLLFQYFSELDQSLEQLVEAAGPQANVMVLSDHGFGPIHDRSVYTLSLMQALDLGETVNRSLLGRFRRVAEGRLGLTPGQMRRWAQRVLPRQWAARIDARFRNAQLAAGARGQAYVVAMHAYIGGIYINHAQFPEAGGLESFRRRLMGALEGLADPQTGQPLIERVHRREELYWGERMDECTDLIFYVKPGYGLADGVGPQGQLVSPRRRHLKQQGVHREEGILILRVPEIRAGQGQPQRLLDITATLLHLLDLPIPAQMDSQPILEALRPEALERRAPRQTNESLAADQPEGPVALSPKDQEQLMSRLRGLGYVD